MIAANFHRRKLVTTNVGSQLHASSSNKISSKMWTAYVNQIWGTKKKSNQTVILCNLVPFLQFKKMISYHLIEKNAQQIQFSSLYIFFNKSSDCNTLRKIPQFHLIFSCRSFVETVRKLCGNCAYQTAQCITCTNQNDRLEDTIKSKFMLLNDKKSRTWSA